MKKTIALLLAAILLLSLAACGQTTQPAEPAATEVPAEAPAEVESSAEPDNSNVDYSLRVAQMGTSIKAAMVVLANEMGYYAEEGLDVTFEPINNLNDGITAILGGSLDILLFGVIPTCTFVAQGADLTVIGGTIAEGSECVMTPENAATYTDGDLTRFAGKTVACVRPETGHMIMMQKIAQAGVDMTTVKFVELDGFQSVVEAVLKGEADVGFVNSGFGQNARTQGLEVPFLVGEYAPNAVCCRQTALKSNVEANRDAYVRFEIANLRAMMLMLTDKETTIAKLVEFSGLDEQYVYNCIYDGVMKISMDPSANRVQEFYEIMQANGDIAADSEYDMTDHVDSGIYYDALTTVMERYPDFDGWTAMMEAYEENNL